MPLEKEVVLPLVSKHSFYVFRETNNLSSKPLFYKAKQAELFFLFSDREPSMSLIKPRNTCSTLHHSLLSMGELAIFMNLGENTQKSEIEKICWVFISINFHFRLLPPDMFATNMFVLKYLQT